MKYPKISIITCTYNGERVIEDYLKAIFNQNYPIKNIEIIFADGGSKDKTIEIINKYKRKYPKIIKLFHNYSQYSDGRGKGYDIFSRKAKNDFLIFLDQDNILVQKNWLISMVSILQNNKKISAVQSRMIVPKDGTIIDKYLNALGIEDPFAMHYSLNAQIVLNPKKFEYNEKEKFYVYQIDKENFYYAGSNGFLIRRKDFLKTGGWSYDIDNFYRMAKKNYCIAIPKEVKLYHKTSTDFVHFFKKRCFYVQHYLLEGIKNRDFYWINFSKNSLRQNVRFILSILYNLLIIPGFIQGIKMAIKQKKSFWMIHPLLLFAVTAGYIYSFFYSLIFKRKQEAKL